MPETEQTLPADASVEAGHEDANATATDATQADPSDAKRQEGDALAFIKETVRRDFKTVEEARKYLENLNRMVGDQTVAKQRERAKIADTLITRVANENGWTLGQAEDYLTKLSMDTTQTQGAVPAQQLDPNIEERLRRGEWAEFLIDHQDARQYKEKLDEITKATGKSYKDAFETFYGDILKERRERKQAEDIQAKKMEATVTASANTDPEKMPDEYGKLMAEYRKTGKSDFLHAAIKIKNKMQGVK